MKPITLTCKSAINASLLLLSTIGAQATSYQYTEASGQTIFDNDSTGIFSTLSVASPLSGFDGLSVHLDVQGGFNGDLFAYLFKQGYDPGYAVLLNRIGRSTSDPGSSGSLGQSGSGLDITFGTESLTDIHQATGNGVLGGNWKVDGRESDPLLTTTSVSRTALLSSFDGINPNGDWTLFIGDFSPGGGDATLVSWSLNFETAPAVPEFAPTAMLLSLGVVTLAVFGATRKAGTKT